MEAELYDFGLNCWFQVGGGGSWKKKIKKKKNKQGKELHDIFASVCICFWSVYQHNFLLNPRFKKKNSVRFNSIQFFIHSKHQITDNEEKV